MSRDNAEKWEDLELRLAPSFLSKERSFTSLRGPSELIVIDDEEEEEQAYYDPIASRETSRFNPSPSSLMHEICEGDLDLRLGIGAPNGSSGSTIGRDTCGRKRREAPRSHLAREFTEVKLRCAICMDTMKEETSTLCGHIFCKTCITNSILALKRCPSCRKELSISSIHRIFLPGATS